MKVISMYRVLICLLALCSCASARNLSGPSSVPLYGKAVFRLAAETVPAQPYRQEEASADLLLTAPSGRRLVLPAFWDGASSWEARFTPQEEGRYTCRFVLRQAGEEPRESAAHLWGWMRISIP